jgi:hypoxanthine phosphoribosyltransferase
MFMADLMRTIGVEYEIDFMSVSSYGFGTQTSGSVKIKKDLSVDPFGKHVLIIEDLIDTGTTLSWIKEYLRSKNCASVAMCCLLDKKARRTTDVFVDYVGWECPDEFVVGYGMDFAGTYRCMPFVGILVRF